MSMIRENYRLQSDRRQFGGLMMILGFCAIIQPLGGIVSSFGPDGALTTDPSEIPFWGMIAAFCLFTNGVVAVIIGYMSTVHDWSHRYLTAFSVLIIQTAFIPYITDMTAVGKGATASLEEQQFIPSDYEPTETDVKFVGAMGILGIATYGFAFVGAISFMAFCLHAYNTGTPEQRSGAYFEGRMGLYSFILALGGLAQLMLGAYCRVKFDNAVYREGIVHVAMFFVSYPTISMCVGLIQVFTGIWGVFRSVGYHSGPNDYYYQIILTAQWVAVLTLQVVAQIAYAPEGELALAAPTVAAMSLGINLMPAFLDQKMRTLPAQFDANYSALPTHRDVKELSESGSMPSGVTADEVAMPEIPETSVDEEPNMSMNMIAEIEV
ncbi:expressed unknown protein [Seminavis robusta]|uniref:Uncharacterized protein n=1 Tax=Seminavis robusta TaxID=568900 RepID=A0A9N8DPX4_9STRA|nr:expressed unknown protein [Seminavis robusta]|eukprot:Sro287_g108540.1 n/a (380) ;mRNA; f:23299-24526